MSTDRIPLSYLTAYFQLVVGVLFVLGYFAFMFTLFLGNIRVADNLLELGKTLAIALTGALGLLFAFLYLRSRVDSPPPAGTTTSSSQSTEVASNAN